MSLLHGLEHTVEARPFVIPHPLPCGLVGALKGLELAFDLDRGTSCKVGIVKMSKDNIVAMRAVDLVLQTVRLLMLIHPSKLN